MRHAALATRLPPSHRGTRRWRRMRARIGLMALWAALLVWALGASLRVPGEVGASPAVAVVAGVPAVHVDPEPVDLDHVDLERAAAWPRESADAWQAPDPEAEAALYIAGR